MALRTLDDDSLMESLFEIFRCHGYEGSTISRLSELTGLRKSSLYHRFPGGKDDMVKAVVNHVSAQLQQHVIAPLSTRQDPPEKRFDNMLATLKSFYDTGKKNCLLNVLSLGEAKDEIRKLLSHDYDNLLKALCLLGQDAGFTEKEAGMRAEHFLVTVQGALVVQRLSDNPCTFENCMMYEKRLFFSNTGKTADQKEQ